MSPQHVLLPKPSVTAGNLRNLGKDKPAAGGGVGGERGVPGPGQDWPLRDKSSKAATEEWRRGPFLMNVIAALGKVHLI